MLLNNWYVACRERDIPEGRALGLALLGAQIVVLRRQGGALACLSGFCCHANASLAGAAIRDDGVICPDHGWAFGADGACRAIPGVPAGATPAWARIDSYPIFADAGWAWVYMGEAPGAARMEAESSAGSDWEHLTIVVEANWRDVVGQIGADGDHDGFAGLGQCTDWRIEGLAHHRRRGGLESRIACTPIDPLRCRIFIAARSTAGAVPWEGQPDVWGDHLADAILHAASGLAQAPDSGSAMRDAADAFGRSGNLIDVERLKCAAPTRPYAIASPARRTGAAPWVFRTMPLLGPEVQQTPHKTSQGR